jgi:hypothetical protein
MAVCAIPPKDKRALAQKVGRQLTKLHGRRQTYSPQLVKAAMRRCELPDMWDCWAFSLFSSPEDFASYHAKLGEVCDYTSMHTEMLSVLDTGSVLDFFSSDSFNIDLPTIADVDISHHL